MDNGSLSLRFDYAIKNMGMSPSGPLNEKIYISGPIKFNHLSIDEPKFKYETYAPQKVHDPSEIPGGNYTIQYTLTIGIENKQIPPKGKYPILLKLYYGKGKLICANFNLIAGK